MINISERSKQEKRYSLSRAIRNQASAHKFQSRLMYAWYKMKRQEASEYLLMLNQADVIKCGGAHAGITLYYNT